MKATQCFAVVFCLTGVGLLRAQEAPSRFAFGRYAAILGRCPFGAPTAPSPVRRDGFPKDLYISSVVHTADGDELLLKSLSDPNLTIRFKSKLNPPTKSP